MGRALDMRSLLAKLARMTLVFLLVFWSSLRVEYLVAYAEPGEAGQGEAVGTETTGSGGETGGGIDEGGSPADTSGADSPSQVEAVKIAAVEILDKDGKPFENDELEGEPELSFKSEELPIEYQLQATVEAENSSFAVYHFPADGALSQFSQGDFSNLEWKVTNPADPTEEIDSEIAKVDDKGVLKITAEGAYRITCVARANSTTEEMPAVITVVVNADADGGDNGDGGETPKTDDNPDDADLQGAPNAQDSLTIVSSGKLDAEETVEPGIPVTTPADGAEKDNGPQINRMFSATELETLSTLPKSTETFSLTGSGKALTVTGYGFDVMDLLEGLFADAGLDIDKASVESVDFIDYRGVATNVPWSFLKGGSTLLAFKSRVQLAGGESGEGASTVPVAEAGTTEETPDGTLPSDDEATPNAENEQGGASVGDDEADLPANTRFRLLADFPESFDADSLRWINTIQINGREVSDGLTVRIDYTPVPMDVDTELVAVPSYEISGSWNCEWRVSTDRGQTYEVVPGASGQSLRVPTNEATVGCFYQVTINNEPDKNGGEALSATSDPVELKALDVQDDSKPSLVLSYNPPMAGDVAIFRSSVYGYDGDVSQFEYRWEWTVDGGVHWKDIEGETKPTLKIPTEPINDDDAASDGSGDSGDESASLIYIRVWAKPPHGEEMASNVQPLTVRVGDEDNTPGGSDDDGTVYGEDEPMGDPNQQDASPDASGSTPTDNPTDGQSTDPAEGQSQDTPQDQQFDSAEPVMPSATPSYGVTEASPTVNVTEIDSIELEYSDEPAEALNPEGVANPTTPKPVGDPSQLYINDAVTERVHKQERAAEEYQVSTTPGARWTALNTLDPDSDDVSRVLDGNPFAPLVIPFGLGLTAAGGVEKLLFFRRQTQ